MTPPDLIGSSVLFLLPPFELFERAIWNVEQLTAQSLKGGHSLLLLLFLD